MSLEPAMGGKYTTSQPNAQIVEDEDDDEDDYEGARLAATDVPNTAHASTGHPGAHR
jgi:hypothetical protein